MESRVKIDSKYSSWSEILFGVPQCSILVPLLLNIFICDMFYFLEDFDIVNYADDSTPYNADKNVESVVNNSEHSSSVLFKWLNDRYMKVNTGKSQKTTVSIHYRNLQALATEMFKIRRGLSPDILREIFVPKISLYNLRGNNTFERY